MSDCNLESKSFFQALEQDTLIGSRCLNCGHLSIPQRTICRVCHSDQAEMVEFSGHGRLAAFTVIYVPPTEMAEAGFDAKNPYCVGIVTLEEGPRVSAQIVNVDLADPSKIKIGMPVRNTIFERGPDDKRKKVLAFEPA